ncbi:MAG: response regulator transcription factor [Bacteroidales bacterium]|nr:response regulator transcription factor [Bacteroidales bacterium]
MELLANKKLNCLVVDDEPFSIEILQTYIEKVPGIHLLGKCKNAIEALSFIHENSIDVLFLDINMPEISGIQLLNSLVDPPLVVFTTAYPEYAIEGFNLDAVDYLLKPFGFERFLKAVDKIYKRIGEKKAVKSQSEDSGFIMVRADKRDYKVNLADIMFIQSKGDYLKITTIERSFLSHDTMQNIMQLLPGNRFIRIHKSFIVSLEKIKYLEGNQVFIGAETIPIGKVYRTDLMNTLAKEGL